MGDKPARRFYVDLRRRNEFDEWGLELQGGWSGTDTWVEVAYVRRDTPGHRAGVRRGDRLITVNDVFVVFSEVREVMEVLNSQGATVAWLELERPTVRQEILNRDLGARKLASAAEVMRSAGGSVRDIIQERYSIRSPRHYNWSVITTSGSIIFVEYNVLNRELSDPLPIAELEKIHEIVRQDKVRAQPVTVSEPSLETKKTMHSKDSSYFETTRKANEFVSKFYKSKTDKTRGF